MTRICQNCNDGVQYTGYYIMCPKCKTRLIEVLAPTTNPQRPICPKCGDVNKVGAKFCALCHYDFAGAGKKPRPSLPPYDSSQDSKLLRCPKCSNINNLNSAFCRSCGYSFKGRTPMGSGLPARQAPPLQRPQFLQRGPPQSAPMLPALESCPICGNIIAIRDYRNRLVCSKCGDVLEAQKLRSLKPKDKKAKEPKEKGALTVRGTISKGFKGVGKRVKAKRIEIVIIGIAIVFTGLLGFSFLSLGLVFFAIYLILPTEHDIAMKVQDRMSKFRCSCGKSGEVIKAQMEDNKFQHGQNLCSECYDRYIKEQALQAQTQYYQRNTQLGGV